MSFKMGEVCSINGGDENLVCTGNHSFKGCGNAFVLPNVEKTRLMTKFGKDFAKPKLCHDCRDRRREQQQQDR